MKVMKNKANSQVEDMCKKLLANLVIEDYKDNINVNKRTF